VFSFSAGLPGGQNQILYETSLMASRSLLNMPLSGIFSRWMGVEGVNNEKFKEFLKKGKNIIFIPGGFEEATLTKYASERIYIKERKGFIKYGLQFGYKVHPCYGFGESKVFYTFNYFEKFRLWLNKIKMPGVIFWGKFLLLPNYDIDICSVIGKGIQLPLIKDPTNEEVEYYHKLYIESITALYNRYKKQFNAAEELEIC